MMIKRSSLLLALFAGMMLGACDHYSHDLALLDNKMGAGLQPDDSPYHTIEPAAGLPTIPVAFSDQLAREYYALAKHENNAAMDYPAARLFTAKAKAAMSGQGLQPEQPDRALIKDGSVWREITLARAELISALNNQRGGTNDAALARSLASYDCWVDQAEENKTGEKATCAERFDEAMQALMPVNADQTRFSVSFLPGQSALAPGAGDAIGRLIAALANTTPERTQISFAGLPEDALSAGRAAALRSVLQFNGVDPAYFAGDTAQAIPAGVRPDSVDIIIKKTSDTPESTL